MHCHTACRVLPQDFDEAPDLMLMGIPCPLFSVLNQKTKGLGLPPDKQYNPFKEKLGYYISIFTLH